MSEETRDIARQTRICDGVAILALLALGLTVALYHFARPALTADPVFDFPTYYYAYQAWAEGDDPYQRDHIIAAAARDGYQGDLLYFLYPPGTLLLFAPLCAGLDFAWAYRVWLALSHLALLGTVLLWIRLRGGPLRSVQNLLLAGMALGFWPVWLSFDLGQINVLLFLLLTLALCAHARRAPAWLVALILVLGGCIKLIPLVLFAALVFRREWRACVYGALWMALAVLAQGLFFGWGMLQSFVQLLAQFAGHRYDILTNVSLKGFLWRQVNAGYLPNDAVAMGLFYVLAVVLLGLCLWVLWQRPQANLALQGGLLLTTFFLLSSPSSIHHLTLLLVAYCALVDVVTHPRCPRPVFWLVGMSYLLNGLYWGMYQLNDFPRLAPLQTMATFGLLLLFAGLVVLLTRRDVPELEWPIVPRAPWGAWGPGAGRAAAGLTAVGLALLLTPSPLAQGIDWRARMELLMPQRPKVLDMVVIAPDTGSYLRAVGDWTPEYWYPVLLEDAHWVPLFLNRFAPARVVVAAPEGDVLIGPAQARRALLAAWSEQGYDAVEDDGVEAMNVMFENPVPMGMTIFSPGATSVPGLVALSAGHRQPIAMLPRELPSGTRAMSRDGVTRVEQALRDTMRQAGWATTGLGRGIDVVTLATDLPMTYEEPNARVKGHEALDDALLRGSDGRTRDAYVARLVGGPAQSVYMAMCSLFLSTERVLGFSTYDGRRPGFEQYTNEWITQACPEEINCVTSNGPGSRAEWRRLLGRRNPFDMVLVCSSGAENSWTTQDGTATTEDLILSNPAAVYWVHSWSAKNIADPDTIAGRWLAHGAFVYYGAVSEPYLAAFHPPFRALGVWGQGHPFIAACRQERGSPWRLTYLGDPLYRMRAQPLPRVPSERGQTLAENIAALRVLEQPSPGERQTLAQRLWLAGEHAACRAVVDELLAHTPMGQRARAAAGLGVLAAHAQDDDEGAADYYRRYNVGGNRVEDQLGAYVHYLDSMKRLIRAAVQADDKPAVERMCRELITLRPGNNSVRRLALETMRSVDIEP